MKRSFVRNSFWLLLIIGVGMAMIGGRKYSQEATQATYEHTLTKATYESILAMVEPGTGLPHDRFDASMFDIMPQFAVIRTTPYVNKAEGVSLESWRCMATDCWHTGQYGLKIEYEMPSGTWASYNIDSTGFFDVSKAAYLQAWVKGAQGDERFEFVLWSNRNGRFPGRPDSALISVSQTWELRRISLEEFQPYADLSSLCRLSIGFNDAIHPKGTIYIDEIAFVDTEGNRINIPLDEETNVTNIGLYMASILGALDLGLENYDNAINKLSTTLASIEALQKWHGFPQTYNHIVSLSPSTGDLCISTVDLGNLAAGLIMLRQSIPELRDRTDILLKAMEWDWLYDSNLGLPYACRYPDGQASDNWHYDLLGADSRLAHFIGIGSGKIPPESWNNLKRTHQASRCINLWHFEPGWDGGGLFMAFLPGIFLDEAESELGTSASNFVQDQICYAKQIGAPAWGWSATALPPYGEEYCGYGCGRDEFLVPHASILAADSITTDVLEENLRALEELGARQLVTDGNQTFDFGFRASLDWEKGEVASVYLVLDQSMAFLSLVNQTTNGGIRKLFCQDEITRKAIGLIPDYYNSCICYQQENFNSLDPNDWSKQEDVEHTWTRMVEENVKVSDGILEIAIDPIDPLEENIKAEGGEILSKRLYQYDIYRAKIKAADGAHVVSSFFTFWSGSVDPNGTYPNHEIDIEILRNNKGQFEVWFVTWTQANKDVSYHRKNLYCISQSDLGFDPSAEYHEYAFNWQKDKVKFYIDGNQKWTSTEHIPDKPGNIAANGWSTCCWNNPNHELPIQSTVYYIDYIIFQCSNISVLPPGHDFGEVKIGSSSTQTFAISNMGDVDLVVSGITLSETTDFTLDINGGQNPCGSLPLTIAPGSNKTLAVTFTPSSTGKKTANLTINSDDADTLSKDVSLTGKGISPRIAVSPPSHDFGKVKKGSSLPQTFTISNMGDADLVVSGINLSDPNFTLDVNGGQNPCGSPSPTIEPDNNKTLAVAFTPSSKGAKTVNLTITSDDPNAPILLIPLKGEGEGNGNGNGRCFIEGCFINAVR